MQTRVHVRIDARAPISSGLGLAYLFFLAQLYVIALMITFSFQLLLNVRAAEKIQRPPASEAIRKFPGSRN